MRWQGTDRGEDCRRPGTYLRVARQRGTDCVGARRRPWTCWAGARRRADSSTPRPVSYERTTKGGPRLLQAGCSGEAARSRPWRGRASQPWRRWAVGRRQPRGRRGDGLQPRRRRRRSQRRGRARMRRRRPGSAVIGVGVLSWIV